MAPPSKRGLAWPTTNTLPTHLFTRPGSKISWLYNWSPDPTLNSTISFHPMQWNHVNAENLPEKMSSCGATHLLAFNEPELDSQSNMTPSHAAQCWLEHIEPLRKGGKGIKAGSPGISSAPQGVPWLLEFLSLIRKHGSDVDFFCLHWYGEGLGSFYDYLWSAYYQLGGPDSGKKVWITEFAATNWNAEPGRSLPTGEVGEFLKKSTEYLDGLEWVERYAWFGAMRETEMGGVGRGAALVDAEGKLDELGRMYMNG